MARELTREEFAQEINALVAQKKELNVESVDSGSIYIAFTGQIEFDFNSGIDGEMILFKPYGSMELTIDFSIVDEITKEDDGTYRLEMGNGISDIIIKAEQ